jgi:NAD(P)-dependent dehydrogenase (short-subunit alcohol dehydrogenase family)
MEPPTIIDADSQVEPAPGVLSPAPFAIGMVAGAAHYAPGVEDLIVEGTLMTRMARPEEIVGPVVYLASDASSFVTGDDISVSGGMAK